MPTKQGLSILQITTLSLFEIERLQLGVRRVYSIPGSSPAKMSSNFLSTLCCDYSCVDLYYQRPTALKTNTLQLKNIFSKLDKKIKSDNY